MTQRCTGCGSTMTIEEIRAIHPQAIACCPERHMVEGRDPEHIEEAAKLLAKWIGYAWDGMREDRIKGFPQWGTNGIGHTRYQGGKQDLRDLAELIAATANGESTQQKQEG